MSDMIPNDSTVERGHLNMLVWPVFGGFMAWMSLENGVNVRLTAEDEPQLKERSDKAVNMIFEWLDQHHEDNDKSLAQYRRCFPMRDLPFKMIPLPAAPPFLVEGALDHFIGVAYGD